MPLRNGETQFFSENTRFIEGDWEAHSGIKQHIVIGEIVEITAKHIGVEAQLREESLGNSALEIISARWTYREPQNFRVQRDDLRGAGEQNIFHGRRLQDAVVGNMQQYFPAVNVARYANARAESRFAGDKSIMIEAQACADVPVSLVKIILNVEGGLDIPFALCKCKL